MKTSDWISVKDKLPKFCKEVLVCREQNSMQWYDIAVRIKSDTIESTFYTLDGFPIDDVTHWQPIVLPKK